MTGGGDAVARDPGRGRGLDGGEVDWTRATLATMTDFCAVASLPSPVAKLADTCRFNYSL